jgi:beta-xylosidase
MKTLFITAGLLATSLASHAQTTPPRPSGNPLFPGWYADPEAAIFGRQYWLYPTYSAPYGQQVFFDAFSSPDLVHWTKHPRILDTARVKWAHRAMWAPAIVAKGGKYYLFFGANDYHPEKPNEPPGGIGVAVADNPLARSKTTWASRWWAPSKTARSPSTSLCFRIKMGNTTSSTAAGSTATSPD